MLIGSDTENIFQITNAYYKISYSSIYLKYPLTLLMEDDKAGGKEKILWKATEFLLGGTKKFWKHMVVTVKQHCRY